MQTNTILQFRIELQDIEPLIWRRIQVPGTYSFWGLHVAIQSAFGWNDSHLHEFEVPQGDGLPPRRFGIPLDDDKSREPQYHPLPGWQHRVADYLSSVNPRAVYCYDFGDDWQHAIVLEEIAEAAPGKAYPRCSAGERAGPPDDCGGPPGYASLLSILADPSHEEHAATQRWAASIKGIRGAFDPEAFDEQRVRFANPKSRLKRMLAEMP